MPAAEWFDASTRTSAERSDCNLDHIMVAVEWRQNKIPVRSCYVRNLKPSRGLKSLLFSGYGKEETTESYVKRAPEHVEHIECAVRLRVSLVVV